MELPQRSAPLALQALHAAKDSEAARRAAAERAALLAVLAGVRVDISASGERHQLSATYAVRASCAYVPCKQAS
jgi:hypothetical protein